LQELHHPPSRATIVYCDCICPRTRFNISGRSTWRLICISRVIVWCLARSRYFMCRPAPSSLIYSQRGCRPRYFKIFVPV
jgi:hypothetical protein